MKVVGSCRKVPLCPESLLTLQIQSQNSGCPLIPVTILALVTKPQSSTPGDQLPFLEIECLEIYSMTRKLLILPFIVVLEVAYLQDINI